MKAVALVASGRKKGNCYDFALYTLERLKEKGVDTELINFYEKKILPCYCAYECLQKFDPRKRKNAPCPITDDVPLIWEKAWAAHILLIFVPTYGGLPPASWVAFTQRTQGLTPPEKIKSVVSAVVLASPHLSIGTEWIPAIIADEIKHMNKIVAVYEVFNTAQYRTENLFGCLITENEIKNRLIFLVTRTLEIYNSMGITP
jgi:multimeric flavodoxin WrbA